MKIGSHRACLYDPRYSIVVLLVRGVASAFLGIYQPNSSPPTIASRSITCLILQPQVSLNPNFDSNATPLILPCKLFKQKVNVYRYMCQPYQPIKSLHQALVQELGEPRDRSRFRLNCKQHTPSRKLRIASSTHSIELEDAQSPSCFFISLT